MQEYFEDGSLRELHTADSLEELVPAIKKSLANPKVKFVKIWNEPTGKHAIKNKVSAVAEVKTPSEEVKEFMGESAEEKKQKKQTPAKTFPSGRK